MAEYGDGQEYRKWVTEFFVLFYWTMVKPFTMLSLTVLSESRNMKIQYFSDTDTLLMIFNDNPVVETRDFDENTIVDLDEKGNLVSMTLEHARERADIPNFSYQIAA
jgi:uncharacterized protein YuzE